ncbi:FkbM family methyltransferase [Oceanicola sp. 22II-s10i]|uniref:FkbM family methyltransferase n=1 Tax=Oceanicola sp. 22II-s10i TaxID=1317116 RepID=UPI0020CE3D98|nr:FkbM family methyltransferase [Oceanicola sp. 22II-s10i]
MGVDVPESPFVHGDRVQRINAGRYEEQEIIGALRVVRAGDTVLEMGAGLGIVGGIIAKNLRPARVLSFEANPALIPHIRALYRMNHIDSRISVRNEVLMAEPGHPETVSFHIAKSYLGSSLTPRRNRQTVEVEVPATDFNRLVAKESPDVLVMDIEGGELDILRHGDLFTFRAIVLEFHPGVYGVEAMREAKTIIRDAGFERIAPCSNRVVWACERPRGA